MPGALELGAPDAVLGEISAPQLPGPIGAITRILLAQASTKFIRTQSRPAHDLLGPVRKGTSPSSLSSQGSSDPAQPPVMDDGFGYPEGTEPAVELGCGSDRKASAPSLQGVTPRPRRGPPAPSAFGGLVVIFCNFSARGDVPGQPLYGKASSPSRLLVQLVCH